MGWDLFGLVAPSDAFPLAKRAAQRALEIDPNCAEAHAALGNTAMGFDWDWVTAERGVPPRDRAQASGTARPTSGIHIS